VRCGEVNVIFFIYKFYARKNRPRAFLMRQIYSKAALILMQAVNFNVLSKQKSNNKSKLPER
jgi:hypothetical protein